jgi:hypothetical protein
MLLEHALLARTPSPSSHMSHVRAWRYSRRCLCLQTYFYQAVILLLDHGPDGSYGIILNRPTQYKVSQIKSTVHELLSLFSDNRLFMGGDCGDTAMVVLTHRDDIDGVTQVRAACSATSTNVQVCVSHIPAPKDCCRSLEEQPRKQSNGGLSLRWCGLCICSVTGSCRQQECALVSFFADLVAAPQHACVGCCHRKQLVAPGSAAFASL